MIPADNNLVSERKGRKPAYLVLEVVECSGCRKVPCVDEEVACGDGGGAEGVSVGETDYSYAGVVRGWMEGVAAEEEEGLVEVGGEV